MNFSNPFQRNNKTDADLGFGTQINSDNGRLINQDGSFNVIRKGLKSWTPYQDLVEMSWTSFLFLISGSYILINAFFALFFLLIGTESLTGIEKSHSLFGEFLHCFFFSIQTFTTVGYGAVSPMGIEANIIASLDALIGLMAFALFTGLLFARFSKPQSSIVFSKKAIIAPYPLGSTSLQIRIANVRDTKLMNLSTQVTMAWLEEIDGIKKRRFALLELERNRVFLFPLNWTLVHSITDKSPLFGKTQQDCEKMEIEFLVLVQGYDETYAQTVHSNSSYLWNELIWNVRFEKMYHAEDGTTILNLDKISDTIQ